ncbi:glycosyltransferase family 4 protein [Paenibacillus lautus]|uniref:glycosyltransferase family 4 protein n=1 Tax=Paenibacillus lautus TaxID=1401 RepID=UPI001C1058C2|nr:glycosyltransferase [Paenibacillus lautus]MBU5350632.1 glycosyltransferase [Paenibacillus lautus]
MGKHKVRSVLLVADRPFWAFDHRAKDMMNVPLKHIQYQLKYFPQVTLSDSDRYDLIYAMSLDIARKIHKLGVPLNKIAAGITSRRIFEKHMTDQKKFKPEFITFIRELRGVNSASSEFIHAFQHIRTVHKTPVGVNEKLFTPMKKNNPTPQLLKVGWVGRIDRIDNRELKGYDMVISALKGLPVQLEIRSLFDNYVPRDKMVEFYQSLDLFICSSRSEHIPMPILEAASSGIPIITTKVGIVPELIKSHRNGIIVKRKSSAIREAVQYMIDHPDEGRAMGANARQSVLKRWKWTDCAKVWEQFFMSLMEKE